MDKYAVDLDQVLNDFEYSELTDQYNNASRSASATTSSLPQNNVTKHSINNVFHSLNEYLNTNISVNSVSQIDNNLLENKENYACDANVVNVNHIKLKDEETSIKDCNSKTDTLLLDFNGETNEDNVSESEVKNTEEEKKEGDVSDLKDNEEMQVEKVIEENSSNIIVGDEKEKTDVYINGNCDDNLTKEIQEAPKQEISLKEIQTTEAEESKEVEDVVDKNSVEKATDEVSVEKTTDEVSVEKIDEIEHPVEKIGFDSDVELDDSEVMKLLDELEDEGLEITEEHKSNAAENLNAPCVDGTETDLRQIEDKRTEETPPVTSSTQNSETEAEPVVAVTGNVATDNEVTNVQETTAQSGEVSNLPSSLDSERASAVEGDEKAAIEEAPAGDVAEPGLKMGPVASEEENAAKQPPEGGVDEKIAVKEKEIEEPEAEEESSVDSLSRPQNLPLNGEGDQPKRKIDLIGEPGSTPYNNVYINKEIPKSKDKGYDSDTDYSTSSSPTFSDAGSTTSTVSADEAQNSGGTSQYAGSGDAGRASKAESTSHKESSDGSVTAGAADPADPRDPAAEGEEQAVSEPPPPPEEAGGGANGVAAHDTSDPEGALGAGAPHIENLGEVNVSTINMEKQWLGKEAPLWVPDSDAMSCLHCDMKFTVLKRRHHCRACGLVLCSKCCHLRFRLEYLDAEARVCNKCHDILNKDSNSTSSSDMSPDAGNSPSHRPNPNNPLEYCSTVSPLQQTAGANPNPPAVMVPVGVLKRKGSNKGKSNKSVMFCDGIRPGSDLTNLDNDFDYNNTKTKKPEKAGVAPAKPKRNLPAVDPETNTFIPSNENCLPPTVAVSKTEITYGECANGPATVEILKDRQLTFALHVNLYVHLKIVNMSCCINKTAWCFSTEGLINVGQDEIVILLEYIEEESFVPKDVFYHINNVHNDAVKGTSVKELGLSLHNASNFLDSKNHAGFVYVRPTFQCLENVLRPKEPYLVGILIHRWETPWAKLFPLRLILRLGAEYRYYPSPIISTRHRESVFVEIGHTIINLLADFRNFSYTLPQIRGLTIHMEDKNTTITIPANRYDQVMKSMSNSSDHILAFAGNFSQQADSHLVCIQDTQGNENCYSTHAINIHNKPRKVTGASFIVFNGALKSSSGLTAKSNIVEDGLMIQVPPERMQLIRDDLRAMKDHAISCGCVNAASDETVNIVWGENDVNFNVGVVSAIDNTPLAGVPSIRVHNAKNHICANGSRFIRWTEVFIIQNGEDSPKNQDTVDVSRVSESIAKATCDALVKYLDLLVANSCQKIGIRTTLHVDDVSYSAGSNGAKLPPIYMKSLDDELIPVLHRITTNNLGEHSIVLELVFRILNL